MPGIHKNTKLKLSAQLMEEAIDKIRELKVIGVGHSKGRILLAHQLAYNRVDRIFVVGSRLKVSEEDTSINKELRSFIQGMSEEIESKSKLIISMVPEKEWCAHKSALKVGDYRNVSGGHLSALFGKKTCERFTQLLFDFIINSSLSC